MATPLCVLGDEAGPPPPVALLGVGCTVLASLCAVTGSKWLKDCADREAREAGDEAASELAGVVGVPKTKKKVYKQYTIDDVKLHCTAEDAWVAIGDGVYNVTKWAPHHPGGERNIVDISGRYVGCIHTPANVQLL